MTQYDSKVIQKYADYLYSRANAIILMFTVIGFLMAAAVSLPIILRPGGTATTGQAWVIALIHGAVGAVIGRFVGKQRAFSLMLQAQTALCQVQIEMNTRSSVATRAVDAA